MPDHIVVTTTTRLRELYDAAEARMRADGLTRTDAEVAPGNRLHQWVQTNCRYRPETEWFICFELACRLGANEIRKETL